MCVNERTDFILTFYQEPVQSLSNSDMNISLGVLKTAHSIFREWRSRARFEAFWSIIKLVCSKFLVLYFHFFEMNIKLPLVTSDPSIRRIINLYYDFTCQDVAPEFEDRHETLFAGGSGYFMQFMA